MRGTSMRFLLVCVTALEAAVSAKTASIAVPVEHSGQQSACLALTRTAPSGKCCRLHARGCPVQCGTQFRTEEMLSSRWTALVSLRQPCWDSLQGRRCLGSLQTGQYRTCVLQHCTTRCKSALPERRAHTRDPTGSRQVAPGAGAEHQVRRAIAARFHPAQAPPMPAAGVAGAP